MTTLNEQLEELFHRRYTCKGYDPEHPVSDEDFHTILEAGRMSPSSMGFEPWHFVRMRNRQILEEIRPYCWGAEAAFDGASHNVFILARMPADMRWDSEYLDYIQREVQDYPRDRLDARKARFKSFQEEDFRLMDSERALFDWTCKQTYIPMANMLMTAAALGVDSTPIEGFHQEKVHDILVAHGVYDPAHFKIASMVAFGYANRAHRPKTRRPLEEVFTDFH